MHYGSILCQDAGDSPPTLAGRARVTASTVPELSYVSVRRARASIESQCQPILTPETTPFPTIESINNLNCKKDFDACTGCLSSGTSIVMNYFVRF